MAAFVALVRAVNLPGTNRLAMSALRDLVAALGFSDAQTLLQSGNVVFRGAAAKSDELETALEREAARRLGLRTDFIVRTAKEWGGVVARNPFADEAERDPARLIVAFLKASANAKDVAALQAAIKGNEVVRGNGREAYIVYPDGQGRSKLTLPVIEKALGTRATARNWNTVRKLEALSR